MENEEGKEEYFLISLSALASHDKTLNANVSEMSESDYLSGALRDIKLFFFVRENNLLRLCILHQTARYLEFLLHSFSTFSSLW